MKKSKWLKWQLGGGVVFTLALVFQTAKADPAFEKAHQAALQNNDGSDESVSTNDGDQVAETSGQEEADSAEPVDREGNQLSVASGRGIGQMSDESDRKKDQSDEAFVQESLFSSPAENSGGLQGSSTEPQAGAVHQQETAAQPGKSGTLTTGHTTTMGTMKTRPAATNKIMTKQAAEGKKTGVGSSIKASLASKNQGVGNQQASVNQQASSSPTQWPPDIPASSSAEAQSAAPNQQEAVPAYSGMPNDSIQSTPAVQDNSGTVTPAPQEETSSEETPPSSETKKKSSKKSHTRTRHS